MVGAELSCAAPCGVQVETDKVIRIRFENVGKLPPPVLQFTQVGGQEAGGRAQHGRRGLGMDLGAREGVDG